MKGILKITLAISMTYTISALAQDPNLPPPPPLSDYMAYKTPRPPFNEQASERLWYLKNFYIAGRAGYSAVKITGITNVTPPPPPPIVLPVPPVIKSEVSQGKFTPKVAIGYKWRKSGLFNRFEIEYSQRTNLSYNSTPFLNFGVPVTPNQINSTVDNYTLLLKGYTDIDLGYRLVPFIQVGAGADINGTSGSAAVPGTSSLSISDDTANFAWDAGLGVNYYFADNFWLDAGYEFDWLGKVKWNAANSQVNVPLEADNMYANAFTIGLNWMPIS